MAAPGATTPKSEATQTGSPPPAPACGPQARTLRAARQPARSARRAVHAAATARPCPCAPAAAVCRRHLKPCPPPPKRPTACSRTRSRARAAPATRRPAQHLQRHSWPALPSLAGRPLKKKAPPRPARLHPPKPAQQPRRSAPWRQTPPCPRRPTGSGAAHRAICRLRASRPAGRRRHAQAERATPPQPRLRPWPRRSAAQSRTPPTETGSLQPLPARRGQSDPAAAAAKRRAGTTIRQRWRPARPCRHTPPCLRTPSAARFRHTRATPASRSAAPCSSAAAQRGRWLSSAPRRSLHQPPRAPGLPQASEATRLPQPAAESQAPQAACQHLPAPWLHASRSTRRAC